MSMLMVGAGGPDTIVTPTLIGALLRANRSASRALSLLRFTEERLKIPRFIGIDALEKPARALQIVCMDLNRLSRALKLESHRHA